MSNLTIDDVTAAGDLLPAGDLSRVAELGVFAVGEPVERDLVRALWRVTGGMSAGEADRLCRDLGDLSMVSDHGGLHILVPGVVASCCAGLLGIQGLAAANEALVVAARGMVPTDLSAPSDWIDPTDDETGSDGDATGNGLTAWWRLPPAAGYLWRHLCLHLSQAGRMTEAAALSGDLRWIHAKIMRCGVGAVEEDLARLTEPWAATLARALARSAHLLEAARQWDSSDSEVQIPGQSRRRRADSAFRGRAIRWLHGRRVGRVSQR